jgi:hypothetical protein
VNAYERFRRKCLLGPDGGQRPPRARRSCKLRDMMQTRCHAAGHSNQASDIFARVALQFGGTHGGKSLDGLLVTVYGPKNRGA